MNLRRFLAPVLLLPLAAAFAAGPAPAPRPAAPFPLEAYASLGSNFARDTGLARLGWTEEQFKAFLDGIQATYRGQPYVFSEQAVRLQKDVQERLKQASEEVVREQLDFSRPGRLQAFMKDIAKEHSLQFSDSGLAYRLVSRGSNLHPGPDDAVMLSCEAIAPDGRTALSALALKQQRVKVSDLLAGLAEAVQMMSPKGSALIVLPPDLSYGSGPWPEGVPPGSPIICMVQLHEIVPAP